MNNLEESTHLNQNNISKVFNYDIDRRAIAKRVNNSLGLLDGGNLCIAQGHVLLEEEQDARRKEVINVPDSFYTT